MTGEYSATVERQYSRKELMDGSSRQRAQTTAAADWLPFAPFGTPARARILAFGGYAQETMS